MNSDSSAVLTVAQVARRLSVSPKLIYRMCERGEIPHLRISSRIVIPRDLFSEWVRQKASESAKLAAP